MIATGEPKPGNRNDCTVYRDSGLSGRPVMADGGYQGTLEVTMPYRKPRDGTVLTAWQEDLNIVHRSIRARAEHVLVRVKNWNIQSVPAGKIKTGVPWRDACEAVSPLGSELFGDRRLVTGDRR